MVESEGNESIVMKIKVKTTPEQRKLMEHEMYLNSLNRAEKSLRKKTEENKKLRQAICDIAQIFPADGLCRNLIIEILEKRGLDQHLIKRVKK